MLISSANARTLDSRCLGGSSIRFRGVIMGTLKHYKIFADYHQFYLWDQGEFPTPPIDYTDLDLDRRIKAAPYVVVIQPERNMEVKVTFEIANAPAEMSLDEWDHVAQASLSLPSGKLQIHECTGGSMMPFRSHQGPTACEPTAVDSTP